MNNHYHLLIETPYQEMKDPLQQSYRNIALGEEVFI